MKKLIFLIFIFSISYSVPSYASKVQNYVSGYVTCATDANGAIYVNDEDGGDVSSFAYESDYALDTSSTSFNLTTRGNVNGVEVDIGAHCDITPDNYKIKIYKTGFCSENPYQEPEDSASNTISADLSSCVFMFDNNDGKEVNIQPGKEIDLLEGGIVIPIGTYPFQFSIIDNVVLIKHTQEFVAAPGAADFDILGYNPDLNDKNDSDHKGKICYTSRNDAGNILVSTFSDELGVSGSTTLRGYTLPVRHTGVQPSSLFRCATAIGSGNAGLDWFATILNNLGNNMCKYSPGSTCTRDTSNFRNAAKQDRGFNDNFPTVAQGYYLLKSDNTIATTPENVERIMWIQHDTNNVINITENTIGLKINFKTNNAMTLQIHQDATGSGFDTELMANQIYGKTIFGSVQVKTRRSRGAWR
ncbi:hypothetical protein N9D11_03615 [Candidatus Pelagibacter sp.]|nr:hypothetical protein [Candidatus Pelagibacter sp.]MDA9890174.1 hypothetical protein [Candidatus Pelagibacter sp.]